MTASDSSLARTVAATSGIRRLAPPDGGDRRPAARPGHAPRPATVGHARPARAGDTVMRLLVTGGSGFLGRRVVAQAVTRGHQVTGIARSATAENSLRELGADVVRGNLDDRWSVEKIFQTVAADALLSIASLGFGHADTVVTAAERFGPRRAVFVSTTGIYTTLDPPTKRTRLAAEETIQSSTLAWTIIRPTMIYGGPDDRNMARMLRALRHCPVLPLPGGGRHLQQPVHVEDLAAVLLRAVDTDIAIGRSYNVAGPRPLMFREIVAQSGAAVGRRVFCVSVPVGPVVALVGAHERRAARPQLKAEQIARLVESKAFAIDDAVRDLDFSPRSFADGIRAEAALVAGGVVPAQATGHRSTAKRSTKKEPG